MGATLNEPNKLWTMTAGWTAELNTMEITPILAIETVTAIHPKPAA
jgi:hypothetical protein